MSGENMNTEVAPGDKVSWNWGGGNPSGKAEEVQPHDVTITTHRGNEVKKTGDEENPAVKLDLGGGKPAVKQASELQVEKEGPKHDQAGSATTMSGQNGESSAAKKDEGKKGGLEVPEKKGRGKTKSKSPAPPPKKNDESKTADKKKGNASEKAGKKDEEPANADEKKAEESKKADKKDEEPSKEEDGDKAEEDAKPKEDAKKANGEKEKKKPGRKPGVPSKPKAEKPKKRAATESGEPRRSKRGKTE